MTTSFTIKIILNWVFDSQNDIRMVRVKTLLNPFMHNVFSHPYQLDNSISNFRVVGWYFYHFIHNLKETSVFKQWRI